MNPSAANQPELRDIHLPDPVSWWPLAPGWWISILLIIGLTVAAKILIPKIIKIIKHQPARKLAIKEFKNIQAQYHLQKNEQALIQSLSKLLRRICMTYETRENTAGLTGEAWIEKLNTINPKMVLSAEFSRALLAAPYQNQYQFNSQDLLQQCENWINNLPKESKQ